MTTVIVKLMFQSGANDQISTRYMKLCVLYSSNADVYVQSDRAG